MNSNIGSEALFELINETEAEAKAAATTAASEREKSLDLVACPDPDMTKVVAAELTRDRLTAVLPKLRDKLTTVLDAERRARWHLRV
jgi:hypothetical protein